MIANLPTPDVHKISSAAFKARENQALIRQYSVIGREDDRARELVTARFYAPLRSGSSRVTCILWVKGCGISSSGYAQGYGYHKGSAALADAIDNGGIKLDENIGCCGSEAMREALLAIARAAYPEAEIFGVFEAEN